MRKLKYLSVLICLLALLTLALTSCASRLSTPGGLNVEDATQSLRWNAVKGARFYTVSIEGNENDITTKANYVSLEHLKPGTYEVKIIANGDGESVKDSRAATFKFERAAESGLLYQLINNGTEYQLVDAGTLSGDVVMESVYRNKPVTAIADAALYNNPRITSFTVGENVRTIGEKAFSQCTKLKTVILPKG